MAKKGHAKGRSRRREREGRPERWKSYKQYFLIVCEDEVTEPAYFEQFKSLFPEDSLFLMTIGTGYDPLGVIKSAIRKREELSAESGREIDFTWVVFDKDDANENETKILRFDDAYKLAKEANLNIALSNEVFEVWLLLHFTMPEYNQPISRKDIYKMLESEIQKFDNSFIYSHGKKNILDYIQRYGDENNAIDSAKILRDFHKDSLPIHSNPSTDVALLVEELRSWITFYN